MNEDAEKYLADMLRRRYRNRPGLFAGLAIAIEHEPIVEAFDRINASLREAPVYLEHQKRWQTLEEELSAALRLADIMPLYPVTGGTKGEPPSTSCAELTDLIQKALGALATLPQLPDIQRARQELEAGLCMIHSDAAREAAHDGQAPSDAVLDRHWQQRLGLLQHLMKLEDALDDSLVYYYVSLKPGCAPLPVAMAFRAAYDRRIPWQAAAAVLMLSGRFNGDWKELCGMATQCVDVQRAAFAKEPGPFSRKPKGDPPKPGLILARLRPCRRYGFFRSGGWAGEKKRVAFGGQWLWLEPKDFANARTVFFTPEEAAEHDKRRRLLDRTTPEYEKEIIQQWSQRRELIREEYRHEIGKLKLGRGSYPPGRHLEFEAIIARGVEQLEQEMQAALERFDKENPKPKKRKCKECGVLFMPDHEHDRYHSSACTNRTRQQRHLKSARKRAATAEDRGLRRALGVIERQRRAHVRKDHDGRPMANCSVCQGLSEAMSKVVPPTSNEPSAQTLSRRRCTAKPKVEKADVAPAHLRRAAATGEDCQHEWVPHPDGPEGRFMCEMCGASGRAGPDGTVRGL